jgi:hypothetical protein
LKFPGTIHYLRDESHFQGLIDELFAKQWVVYCKPPFIQSAGVVEYLGRYTHRVAIANHRIIALENRRVTFQYRDYADDGTLKVMTLDACKFIRRFLLPVLPERFVKIRYYELLAQGSRNHLLGLCRELLGVVSEETETTKIPSEWHEVYLLVTGEDLTKCPFCVKVTMVLKKEIPATLCARSP